MLKPGGVALSQPIFPARFVAQATGTRGAFVGRPDRANAAIAGAADATTTVWNHSPVAQKSKAFAKFRHCGVLDPAYSS